MKFIRWKNGIFYLTLVLSILFGFLVAKTTVFYKRILASISDQTQDVMWLQGNSSTLSEMYLLVEFLISFAVPFGLIWLLSFIIIRFVSRDLRDPDWSLIRKMRPSNKHNLRR